MANLEEVYTEIFNKSIEMAPQVIFAFLVLVVGYFVGVISSAIVYRMLRHTGIDSKFKSKNLDIKISSITATAVKWCIYLIAISKAANLLGVQIIIDMIDIVIGFVPGVIIAAVLLIAAYILGYFIKTAVIGEKDVYTKLIGDIIFFLVVYVGIATALPVLGIEAVLINTILILIVGSICLGIAIALGLGLKDTVAEMSKDFAKNYKKKKR